MHCQLAETCRNEVENNNNINGSILNKRLFAVGQRKPNVKHCFCSLFLIVTCIIILNYMNNYNQGNYFLDQLGRLQSIPVHALHIRSMAVKILRKNLSGN